ncbi:MAG: YHS domain-containing protein [Acidobacteria bacterium]|nr:YHS domain-containing protein [Acidobacteriota bacterium]
MRDPVCGMEVSAGSLTVDGYLDVAFCSEHCRSAFAADPDRYAERGGSRKDDGEEDDGIGQRHRPGGNPRRTR